tara:strand:+ start:265 stop:642 length:378 start_codon:yes stop_codon:yes gene_type:complete
MFLKEYRKLANISAAHLAKEMGVTIHGYRRWERGEVEPKASQAAKLAKILNISIDTLVLNKPADDEGRTISISVKPGQLQVIKILGENVVLDEQEPDVYTPSFKLRNIKRKKPKAKQQKGKNNVA